MAVVADRWPQAECIRDTFELLAREIPVSEFSTCRELQVSTEARNGIRRFLPQLRGVVIHKPVLRMIEEIMNQESPSRSPGLQQVQPEEAASLEGTTAFAFYPPFLDSAFVRSEANTFDIDETYWPNFEVGNDEIGNMDLITPSRADALHMDP